MTRIELTSALAETRKRIGESLINGTDINWSIAPPECKILAHESFCRYGFTSSVWDYVVNGSRDTVRKLCKCEDDEEEFHKNMLAAFMAFLELSVMDRMEPTFSGVSLTYAKGCIGALNIERVKNPDGYSKPIWDRIREYTIARCRLSADIEYPDRERDAKISYHNKIDTMAFEFPTNMAIIGNAMLDNFHLDDNYLNTVVNRRFCGTVNTHDNLFNPIIFWTGMDIKPQWGPTVPVSNSVFEDMHLCSNTTGNLSGERKYSVLVDLAIGPFKKAGLDLAISSGAKIILHGIEVPQVLGFGHRKYCPSGARRGQLEMTWAEWDNVKARAIFTVKSYEEIGHDSASVAAVKTHMESANIKEELSCADNINSYTINTPDLIGLGNSKIHDVNFLFGEGGDLWSWYDFLRDEVAWKKVFSNGNE